MALVPGDRIGPYEIQALLGAGGMGEVYRGRDTRLGRDVALKVIAPRLAGDPAFRRRFELEARAASTLNHPSIVTIYDVGDMEGLSWIAMEWVEGRTLRQALADGPLPVREAWSIARQISDGLAAAHAKGIVHRDLKPENVMLAPDGRAKILDFGLARHSAVDALDEAHSTVQTVAGPARATLEGSILGTVGYMSPEQAAGRPVDFRSDQFAIGLLAYEMLSGRQAFTRPTAVETLSAIIREDPVPLASIRSGISDAFHTIISRCLSKAPTSRFDSTRDLASALGVLASDVALPPGPPGAIGTVLDETPASGVETRRARLSRRVWLAAAGVVLVAAAAMAWGRLASKPRSPVDSLAVLPFETASNDSDAAFLGDGLTEALITQMSQVPSLRVMAKGTAFRFKGVKDPQEAGRQLGVGAVLVGRVARNGDRLRISAELIEITTGARLWGETYDGRFADVLQVQDRIATSISDGLRLRLSGEERRTLARHGTDNAEAYELLLKGRYLLTYDTEADDVAARALFQKAVAIDPQFIEARLDTVATFVRSAGNLYAPPKEAWTRAEEELKKVLDVEPGNIRARAMLATRRFMYDWDWATAEREFLALGNDPRIFLSNSYHPVALFLCVTGRPDESVAVMERALRVDPGNLESRVMLGDFLAQAGRLDDAVAHYTAIASTAPDDARPLFGWADILRRRGKIDAAIETLRKAYDLSGEEYGTRALAAARTEADFGRAEMAVARERLGDLEALSKERYVSPLDLARLHAQLGERDQAFATLDWAFAERSPGLVSLKIDHAWDRIRDDTRFATLVRRVGIP